MNIATKFDGDEKACIKLCLESAVSTILKKNIEMFSHFEGSISNDDDDELIGKKKKKLLIYIVLTTPEYKLTTSKPITFDAPAPRTSFGCFTPTGHFIYFSSFKEKNHISSTAKTYEEFKAIVNKKYKNSGTHGDYYANFFTRDTSSLLLV